MQSTSTSKNTKPQADKQPIRALILPGGGGRGAYQIGVAKALFESGLKFDYIFGTSIGAINATFIAQGDLDKLAQMWSTVRLTDLFHLPFPTQLAGMLFGTKLGMLDPSPLEGIISREINFDRLKSSSTKIGLFTTDLCSLETRLFSIDEITSKEELIAILMASSAIPIIFPPRQLYGSGLWIDGGLVKNTPMQAAIDLGAEELFVVLLHPDSINTCPTSMLGVVSRCLDITLDTSSNREIQAIQLYNQLLKEQPAAKHNPVSVHIFQPHRPVNLNLLEIDPAMSKQLIKMGYEDAKHQLEDPTKGLIAS